MIRTWNFLIQSQTLFQLSYIPFVWRKLRGSNSHNLSVFNGFKPHKHVNLASFLLYGTQGESRTLNIWNLNPAPLPIGLPEHGTDGQSRTDNSKGLNLLPLPIGPHPHLYLVGEERIELSHAQGAVQVYSLPPLNQYRPLTQFFLNNYPEHIPELLNLVGVVGFEPTCIATNESLIPNQVADQTCRHSVTKKNLQSLEGSYYFIRILLHII